MTIAIVGEAIIDFIANAQGEYRPHLGGSPYNVAIGLARNGESVSYLSPFSSDNFGELMHSSLRREGVQIPVQRRSRYPTSLALVTTNANKQPSYTLYRKGIADTDITFSEIATQLPADLTVLHTGSLAITPDQLPKIRELMQLMQRRSIVISLDLNIRLGASLDTDAYLEGVRHYCPFADLIKASDEDLAPFQFARDAERAARIAYGQQGKGMFVLTQGASEQCCLWATGSCDAHRQRLPRFATPSAPVIHFTLRCSHAFGAMVAAICRQSRMPRPPSARRLCCRCLSMPTLLRQLMFHEAAAHRPLGRKFRPYSIPKPKRAKPVS